MATVSVRYVSPFSWVTLDASDALEVFALFGDGTIRCTWQNTAGDDTDWSAWHSLGIPGQ
ncbi:hypothetical protein [Streptomyces sp. BRA346]|uniref:hypothetical protein n=1 Tax=Streptomyces sp. BRA346 TaxID=2878199 RepID=UPI004062D07F